VPGELVGLLDAEGPILLESGAAPSASCLNCPWTVQPGLVFVENSCTELVSVMIG
jgi:hypothetical protein